MDTLQTAHSNWEARKPLTYATDMQHAARQPASDVA